MKRLLLLSNSTLPGESFFSWPESYVKEFLGSKPLKILFFPFAGVTFSFDEYHAHVKSRFEEMGYQVEGAHQVANKQKALESCDAIAVGGGNTFQLIHYLQDGWIELIRKEVEQGKPYIGWSAGSNVATPSIKTTNDMPIIEPKSFEALDLVSFQINPHYTEAGIPNHGGETRPDRIKEFLAVNPESTVLGLPEGTLIEVKGNELFFKGDGTLVVFKKGENAQRISSASKLEI